jgi:sugar lactone lactonase YvrE
MARGQGVVAAVAIAAVAACVGLIVYSGLRMYATVGPSKAIATRDGSLYLLSHGRLHLFGADGKRRASYDLQSLGADRKPSDLAVHRDGRVVIASPDGSDLRRCDLGARTCERIDPKLTQIPLQHSLPLNSVKVAIDDERGRYYLSDNAGHRVIATDLAGKQIAASKRGEFTHPNQLALEGDGSLRVVDTNHHRIAVLDASGNTLDRVVSTMSTRAPGIARPGRDWPFDALRTPAGETWALVAADGMKDSDLIAFDAAGKAVRRIDLGDDSDPFDIELWGDRVIVADAINYRVHAVSLEGRVTNAFDDPQFAAELDEQRDVPALWRAARLAAQVGIGLVPLVAILVLRHMGAPVGLASTAPSAVVAPPGGGKLTRDIHWIAIDPGYFDVLQRRALRAMIPSVIIMALTFALGWFLVGDEVRVHARMHDFATPAIGMVVMLAFLPFIGHITRRQLGGYRLGASIAGLHYTSASRRDTSRDRARASWRGETSITTASASSREARCS